MTAEAPYYFKDLMHLSDDEYTRIANARYREIFDAKMIAEGYDPTNAKDVNAFDELEKQRSEEKQKNVDLKKTLEILVSGVRDLNGPEFFALINKKLITCQRTSSDFSKGVRIKGPAKISPHGEAFLYDAPIKAAKFTITSNYDEFRKIYKNNEANLEIPKHLKKISSEILLKMSQRDLTDPISEKFYNIVYRDEIHFMDENYRGRYISGINEKKFLNHEVFDVCQFLLTKEEDMMEFILWLDDQPHLKYTTEWTTFNNRDINR